MEQPESEEEALQAELESAVYRRNLYKQDCCLNHPRVFQQVNKRIVNISWVFVHREGLVTNRHRVTYLKQ